MLVSVHLVTHNSQQLLQKTITSLQKQTCKDFSILAVDNASTDHSTKILKNNHIRTIKLTKNLGYAAAHNLALSKTHAQYVLTLNPDVILDKDFIRNAVNFLIKNPTVGSVNPLLLRIGNSAQFNTFKRVDSAGLLLKKNRGQALILENSLKSDIPKLPFEIFGVDGAAAVYRKSMLDAVSLKGEVFDIDFFCYKEDIDLAWRARLLGWQSFCVPTAIGYHKRSFKPGKRRHINQYLKMISIRNRYFLILKNDTVRNYLKNFPQILIYEVCIFLFICFFEQKSLEAYIQAFQLFPKMLQKRNLLFKKRVVNPKLLEKWFL